MGFLHNSNVGHSLQEINMKLMKLIFKSINSRFLPHQVRICSGLVTGGVFFSESVPRTLISCNALGPVSFLKNLTLYTGLMPYFSAMLCKSSRHRVLQ